MKNSPSISEVGAILSRFLHRYHVIIYSLTIVIGIAAAVFFLSQLVTLSDTAADTKPQHHHIDKETVKQIEDYQSRHDSSVNDTFSLPAGRISPFVE